jgi:hypothetical protein
MKFYHTYISNHGRKKEKKGTITGTKNRWDKYEEQHHCKMVKQLSVGSFHVK